jgi:hypothetical protein
MTLRWEAVPGATNYTLSRRTAGGSYRTVATVAGTTHTDTGLTNGTAYFYLVTADGAASNEARGVPVAPLPAGTTVRWPIANLGTADADEIRYAFGPRHIGRYDFHAGLDVNAPEGTPVHAVMDGTIARKTAWDGVTVGGGNRLVVSHGQSRFTTYLHLHEFADGVDVGSTVAAGQVIGYVGKTGAVSHHLHLGYLVGPETDSFDERMSRSPLELLPRGPGGGAEAVFRTDGSRVVDLSLPAQHNTIRWIILRGRGITRVLDYYEVVTQGSTARDNQSQSGLVLEASPPTLPYPGGGGTVRMAIRPDSSAPWGDFEPERITVLDFHGETLVDRTAYQSWKLSRGITLETADDSDDDADGLPLLVEYALDLDPLRSSAHAAPAAVRTDGLLLLSYRRSRTELSYVVQTSSDLVAWTSAGVTQEHAVDGLMVTASVPAGADPRRFLRLAVTRP